MADRLRELAQRKLPEIDALIDRAQRVREWLQTAPGCDCPTIDNRALFDGSPLPSAKDARPFEVVRVNAAPYRQLARRPRGCHVPSSYLWRGKESSSRFASSAAASSTCSS
jgi:hypothetical protein